MNKTELAIALAERTDLTMAKAREVVEALFSPQEGIIAEELSQGREVRVSGFGRFELHTRQGRRGRHPATGKKIEIGPKTSPRFKPGSKLKALKKAARGPARPPKPPWKKR